VQIEAGERFVELVNTFQPLIASLRPRN